MQNSSDLSHFKMKFLDLKNMKPPIVLGNKKFSLKINILNKILKKSTSDFKKWNISD